MFDAQFSTHSKEKIMLRHNIFQIHRLSVAQILISGWLSLKAKSHTSKRGRLWKGMIICYARAQVHSHWKINFQNVLEALLIVFILLLLLFSKTFIEIPCTFSLQFHCLFFGSNSSLIFGKMRKIENILFIVFNGTEYVMIIIRYTPIMWPTTNVVN